MRRILRPLLDPYRRYRHARLIHAVRVALGLLATILLTTGINLPHGEWASVTMLVVIGGLQHHGNIGKKAAERATGTLIGAGVGLLLVAQEAWLGMPWLTYFAMAVVCGFFSYHAIGKGGYTALLSAITVFIVAGHGDNPAGWAVARGRHPDRHCLALGVFIALPLYAVYSWRYNLGRCLRDAPRIRKQHQRPNVSADEHLKRWAAGVPVMVKLVRVMPPVYQEVKISMTRTRCHPAQPAIVHQHWEILGNTRPDANDPEAMAHLQSALKAEHRQIRVQLIGMARALKSGAAQRLDRPAELPDASLDAPVYSALDGYRLLTRQLAANIGEMRQRLAKTAPH